MMHALGLGSMSYYSIALEDFIWADFLSIQMTSSKGRGRGAWIIRRRRGGGKEEEVKQ